MYYVYIIQNENNELYYGYTKDLRRRFDEHNKGKSLSTRGHVWRLVYYEAFAERSDATEREQKLKNFGQTLGHLKKRISKSLDSKN